MASVRGVSGTPSTCQSPLAVAVMVPASPLPNRPTLGARLAPNRADAKSQKLVLLMLEVFPGIEYCTVIPEVTMRGSSPERSITCACSVLAGGNMQISEKSCPIQCI